MLKIIMRGRNIKIIVFADSLWSPCGVHVESMWSLCGVHVESMWTPLECMWNSGRVLLISCGLHVDSMWSSCGVHRSTNQKCDFLVLHVESMWSPHGVLWSLCGVVESTWTLWRSVKYTKIAMKAIASAEK